MEEYYCKVNEAPKMRATPYDNFCSRDSLLLADVYLQGERHGLQQLAEWVTTHRLHHTDGDIFIKRIEWEKKIIELGI